jgi:hypothetical protein
MQALRRGRQQILHHHRVLPQGAAGARLFEITARGNGQARLKR